MTESVLSLLKEKGVLFSVSGKDYLTKCFNPEHPDTSPSFRIDKVTGIAHCFSCGYKTNIFRFYGILTNNVSIRIAKLKDKIRKLSEVRDGLDCLPGAKPVTKAYRGISAATLRTFSAFETSEVPSLEDRIIFPILDVRDKTICYVGRLLRSDLGRRYQNYPPGVEIPMFPSKPVLCGTSIVLVEGLFDMLNLYDKGLHNVVCTFGTSKLFNDVAAKMLTYKVLGVEKVYIMYDGDTAGREAATKIKPLLEQEGFIVVILNLPEEVDPGDLDQQQVNYYKKVVS